MFNFKTLILHNFGSYQHAEINLQNRGFCLVTGKNNFKKDNASSNGSGKSFLWNAICFALVGETINGLHTNLKNINVVDDPECYVTLCFSENTDHYQLTRQVTPKSDLKIIRNDIDISGKGIRESEKKLVELLPDLTKNLITSTILIGQGMPNRFSSFSPSGRKELLEKLTKADFMIEDIKQRVNNRQQELSSQVREAEDALLAIQSQLRVHEATIKQREQQLAELIKPDFEVQISSKASELESLTLKKTGCEAEIAIEEQLTDKLTEEQLYTISARAVELDSAKKSYEAASKDYLQVQHTTSADIRALEREIMNLSSIRDTCPTCKQKIPGCHKPDLTEHNEKLIDLNKVLTEVTGQLRQQEISYNQIVAEITTRYEAKIKQLTESVNVKRYQISQQKASITTIDAQLNAIREALNRLQYDKETWDARNLAINSEIESTKKSMTALIDKAVLVEETLKDLTEHLKLVRKMDTLIKRDFRGFLLANIITYIDNKAKDYCNIVFGTRDLSVYLEGNDLNISYCGKMFDNLSGGEKQRVDLILQFAIRNMLTAYLNFNSNILVLDEITDFLDKKSCTAILDLIAQELNAIESVFIVSHHATELALPIDSELSIQKNELGISEIILGV